MPKLDGILETSLYVDDLEKSMDFYTGVLGLDVVGSWDDRLSALRLADRQILLLCRKGASASMNPGGHDGDGRLHLALAVSKPELAAWEEWLEKCGVEIEERTSWELGGQSIYFRDPDQHLIELATPGTWKIY
jgi:catechol 2,3-dioxygenase-like lactoylglutathione lyase family enzyme